MNRFVRVQGGVLRISFLPLLAAAVLCASSAEASAKVQPQGAPLEGDGHEILGVALALGDKCQRYRGFEYQFLGKMFRKAYEGSAAQTETRGQIANLSNHEEKRVKASASAKRFADKYRQKAERLGCKNGVQYLDIGMAEAYKEIAAILVYSEARDRASTGFIAEEKLTDLQRQMMGLFGQTAKQMFGEGYGRFEQMMPDLARAKQQEYDRSGFTSFIKDRNHTIEMMHHEALIATSGWDVRGTTLGSSASGTIQSGVDSDYGYHTARLSKNGEPSLTMITDPVFASLDFNLFSGQMADKSVPHGYVSVGIRDDGTIVAGLLGGNFATAPQDLRIKAGWSGGLKEHFVGRPVTRGCPFARCFEFTVDEAKKLANVNSYFVLVANKDESHLGLDQKGATVPRQRMNSIVGALTD